MTQPTSRRGFLTSSVGLTAGAALASQLHSVAYAAPGEPEWIDLFNGETLDGWHKNPDKIGHGTGGHWQVEEGSITGEQDPPGSGNGGVLLTDETFGDFELLIDIKPDWGVCSGLFLRGNDQGQCFQMMVDYHDAGNIGHLYGEGTTGFNTRTFDINGELNDEGQLVGMTTVLTKTADEAGLYHTCAPDEWVTAWKVGDWNRVRVRMEGKYPIITTWINGLRVNKFDGGSAATGNYDRDAIFKMIGAAGSIGVQVHGGGGWPVGAKCRWKNVKIRNL